MSTKTIPTPAGATLTAPPQAKTDISPQCWLESQLVFPVYLALAQQFELSRPACTYEQLCADNRREEVLRAVRAWYDQLDDETAVNQVRQLLQANYAAAEKNLRAFALRLLRKPAKQASDRNKVDFVVVQYFAACAPQQVATREASYADTGQVLRPLLGPVPPIPPARLQPLEAVLEAARSATSLAELLHSKLLEQGRQIKDSLGDAYFKPEMLVGVCRFNYLMRRAFIRNSHADLRVTRDALCQLDGYGIARIDCRAAGLSGSEPVAELHRICADWKHPFRAEFGEYSIPTMLERLIGLRASAEAALAAVPPRRAAVQTAEPAESLSYEPGFRVTQPKPAERNAAPARPAFRSVLALADSVPQGGAARVTGAQTPRKPASPAWRVAEPEDPKPKAVEAPAPLLQAEIPAADPAVARAAAASSADSTAAETISETEVENCSEKIWEQLISAPRDRGRSMSTIQVEGVKLLLSSWEVAAFVSEDGGIARDIRRAVVVRTLLAAALENHMAKGDRGRLAAALRLAANEINRMQGCVEKAKAAKHTEGAVNLSMTAKRLLAFIEQAGDLRV
jgi:hypothetical protein